MGDDDRRKPDQVDTVPASMLIHIGFGIMGGYNQAQAHAQFVSNLVDHNMNIQAALDAPLFTKLTFGG